MVAQWPSAQEFGEDAAAEQQMSFIQSLVVAVRSARSEHTIPPSAKVDAVFVCADGERLRLLSEKRAYLETLAGLGSVEFSGEAPREQYPMRAVVEGAEAYLSWEQGVDPREEIDRLAKRLKKVEGELERTTAKLASDGFVNNAPSEVVERERQKHDQLLEKRGKLNHQIEALENRT
jgi:valyl-tRNA synthetase